MSKKNSLIGIITISLLAMAGCDGSVGFRDVAGELERTSAQKLIRGLADREQQRFEDDETTKNRRDRVEALAKRLGLALSDDFGDLLGKNPAYHSVFFTSPQEAMRGLPGLPVQVEFDIEGGHHAQMQFIVEQATMMGFVRLTRLPIFDRGVVKHGDNVLPIASLDVFMLALSGDRMALKGRADKAWAAVNERMTAAAVAASAAQVQSEAKQAECEKQVQDRIDHFEPDPSLNAEEKGAAIGKFHADQTAAMQACLGH